MSKRIAFFYFLLVSLLICHSSQECQPNINNCKICNPETELCVLCEIGYKPNDNGGCELTHKCKTGENYCNECNVNRDLCIQCELGFFADEIGGCSNTDNCEISENGKCYQCKDNFYLIESSNFNFCKYKFSDDLKNCAIINNSTGKCNLCEENYYLGSYDKKCTNTNNCKKSTFGICTECDDEYFLDKSDDLCKISNEEFNGCKISIDRKICSECNDGFFFTEDGKCSKSRNCAKKNNINNYCLECSNGYFLSKIGNICTTQEHCYLANFEYGFCEYCEESFYIEDETRKCFSNRENNKYKYCKKVSSGKCIMCENKYILTQDNSCTLSLNCLESKNGICIKCLDGYYLGLDNNCVNTEHCKYSNTQGECIECENDYYLEAKTYICYPGINQFKNCKKSNIDQKYCEICNNDFYLSGKDKLCYNNTENNLFYKCAVSTDDDSKCKYCIDNYYVGIKDLKCNKIEGCAISENENKCIECYDNLCLDVKKQSCENNLWGPENKEQIIYFHCNKTNEEGTECEICNNYTELVNGFCVDKNQCAEKKNDECIKCNENSYDGYNLCVNNIYGCVVTFAINCLRCDNIYDFSECTECLDGYILDDNSHCIEKTENKF